MEDHVKETTTPSISTTQSAEAKQFLTSSSNIKILRELKCPVGSTTVAYTDDLKVLASGQEDGSILLFSEDAEPVTMIDYELKLYNEACTDLKIKSSPKGGYNKTLLAGYLTGHIKLWDTTTRKPLFTIQENKKIYGVSYHPRSHRFLSYGDDSKVNIYDEETRVTERILASSGIKGCKNGHSDSVCSAVFHPKNPFELISAGLDHTIQFWDLRAPYAIRNIEGMPLYGDGLDISLDGKIILICVANNPECPILLYDYGTGKLLRSYKKPGCFGYSCKFLSPVYVGIGCYYQNTFRVVNMKTLQVYGFVMGLRNCVMNFAVRRKVPRYRVLYDKLPTVAISGGDRVVEFEIMTSEDAFDSNDVFYEEHVN